MNKLLKKAINKLAEYEVDILKQYKNKVVLDKKIFNPMHHDNCYFGQRFGSSNNIKSNKFKRKNNLFIKFSDTKGNNDNDEAYLTALEVILFKLWGDNKKEQVYKIMEQICTWKEETDTQEVSYKF